MRQQGNGRLLVALALCLAGLVCAAPCVRAQYRILPQAGLQTLWFNRDYPVNAAISPAANDPTAPLGGGMSGNHNGIHLGMEMVLSEESSFRIPVTLEAFFLSGQTTFAVSAPTDLQKQRVTFTHTGKILSAGTGLTYTMFGTPSLYLSGELRLNYIPHTTLNFRQYISNNDSTVSSRDVVIDSANNLRLGLYAKVGTQVAFFEPFMLDFSIGFGVLNLAMKDDNPATRRNLLIVDPDRHDVEQTLTYIGVGLTLVWKL